MGYDLIPKKKEVEPIYFGSFTWPIILKETGAGYIVGYGNGRTPAAYVYIKRRKASPVSNDGFPVTATEAKAMAACARGYVSVHRFINKEWEQMPEAERNRALEYNKTQNDKIYVEPISEKFLADIEKFAEFAEKSCGFKID